MVYEIHYLIYGVKLTDDLIKEIIEYISQQPQYANICQYFTNHNEYSDSISLSEYIVDADLVQEFFDRIWPETAWTPYQNAGSAPVIFGQIVWSSDDCNFFDFEVASNLPEANLNENEMASIKQTIQHIQNSLPLSIARRFPDVDYYWAIGTS